MDVFLSEEGYAALDRMARHHGNATLADMIERLALEADQHLVGGTAGITRQG